MCGRGLKGGEKGVWLWVKAVRCVAVGEGGGRLGLGCGICRVSARVSRRAARV